MPIHNSLFAACKESSSQPSLFISKVLLFYCFTCTFDQFWKDSVLRSRSYSTTLSSSSKMKDSQEVEKTNLIVSDIMHHVSLNLACYKIQCLFLPQIYGTTNAQIAIVTVRQYIQTFTSCPFSDQPMEFCMERYKGDIINYERGPPNFKIQHNQG